MSRQALNENNIIKVFPCIVPRIEQSGGTGETNDDDEEDEEDCWDQCLQGCPSHIRHICETHRFENLNVSQLFI